MLLALPEQILDRTVQMLTSWPLLFSVTTRWVCGSYHPLCLLGCVVSMIADHTSASSIPFKFVCLADITIKEMVSWNLDFCISMAMECVTLLVRYQHGIKWDQSRHRSLKLLSVHMSSRVS